jgi:STE24 endopeptidase
MFASSLVLLWLLGQLIDAPWFFNGLGVPAQNTTLALILFFLVMPIFTFPFSPLTSYLSENMSSRPIRMPQNTPPPPI